MKRRRPLLITKAEIEEIERIVDEEDPVKRAAAFREWLKDKTIGRKAEVMSAKAPPYDDRDGMD